MHAGAPFSRFNYLEQCCCARFAALHPAISQASTYIHYFRAPENFCARPALQKSTFQQTTLRTYQLVLFFMHICYRVMCLAMVNVWHAVCIYDSRDFRACARAHTHAQLSGLWSVKLSYQLFSQTARELSTHIYIHSIARARLMHQGNCAQKIRAVPVCVCWWSVSRIAFHSIMQKYSASSHRPSCR